MPRMGFEPTISVFEQAKTIHALDRAVTQLGTEVDIASLNKLQSSQLSFGISKCYPFVLW
jgi:hypothetical protein